MNLPDMPEAILRRIWQEQNFSTAHLSTPDRRSVTILSPGLPNTDAGPDFLNAKIEIGKTTFYGDVEIHVNADEWRSHKHDTDPHYNRVILHVVLTADPLSPPAQTVSRRPIPLLVLHPFLDEKFQTAWMTALFNEREGNPQSLYCSNLNKDIPPNVILDWIEKLAYERMELKIRRCEERLKQLVDESHQVVREPYPRYYGNPEEIPPPKDHYTKRDFTNKELWEQLLYEGIMEGFGYSRNTKPFLDLSRSMRLHNLRPHSLAETQTMMALLFGAAGLLPSIRVVPDRETRKYVVELKRTWNKLRPGFKGNLLAPADWLFFRLRPSNFPTARLATMCFLLPKLFEDESFRHLVSVFKDNSSPTKERIRRLFALYAFEPDEFWKCHYHFSGRPKSGSPSREESASTHKGGVKLGAARINDILMNTVIPVILLYARVFKDSTVAKNTRSMLAALPPSQDNPLTEIIQDQLAGEKAALNSALLHQGAIQLYRFYCAPARCLECAIGRKTTLSAVPCPEQVEFH